MYRDVRLLKRKPIRRLWQLEKLQRKPRWRSTKRFQRWGAQFDRAFSRSETFRTSDMTSVWNEMNMIFEYDFARCFWRIHLERVERCRKSSTFHLVFRCFQLVASQWGRWGGRGPCASCARELTQKQAQDLAAKASAAKAAVEEAQALSIAVAAVHVVHLAPPGFGLEMSKLSVVKRWKRFLKPSSPLI